MHVGPYVEQLSDPLLSQVVVPPSMTINRKNALRYQIHDKIYKVYYHHIVLDFQKCGLFGK